MPTKQMIIASTRRATKGGDVQVVGVGPRDA